MENRNYKNTGEIKLTIKQASICVEQIMADARYKPNMKKDILRALRFVGVKFDKYYIYTLGGDKWIDQVFIDAGLSA